VQQDAAQHYEFKILHGGPTAFRGQEHLQRVLEQESRAQWELVMKLDDARLVLRRPRDARSRDALRGAEIDPYRTQIGSPRTIAAGAVMLGVLAAVILGLLVVGQAGAGSPDSTPWLGVTLGLGIIIVIAFVMMALVRRR
jgi:hypothetical protein